MSSTNPRKATLVPEATQWDDATALTYLLRHSPHTVDPNLPSEYVNGWYDDARRYSDEVFVRILTEVITPADTDDLATRVRLARQVITQPEMTLRFLRTLFKEKQFDGNFTQLTDSIAHFLATRHLHLKHRLRMVPPTVAEQWSIPGLSAKGKERLACCRRSCDSEECTTCGIRRQRQLKRQRNMMLPSTPTQSNEPTSLGD